MKKTVEDSKNSTKTIIWCFIINYNNRLLSCLTAVNNNCRHKGALKLKEDALCTLAGSKWASLPRHLL